MVKKSVFHQEEVYCLFSSIVQAFQVALVLNNLAASAEDIRDVGSILWGRAWQPTLLFLPGESHGQRSLAGYGL